MKKALLLLSLLIVCWPLAALQFNTQQLQVLQGKKKQLGDHEGYLYLAFASNTDLTNLIIDHVDSGKKLKFKTVQQGSNHALIKLKAGTYYWKGLQKSLGATRYQFQYDKSVHQFEVSPGVVNYPGSWQFDWQWDEQDGPVGNLSNSNQLAYEWPHYLAYWAASVDHRPLAYQGAVQDLYLQHMQSLLDQNPQVAVEQLNHHGLSKHSSSISYYDVFDGVAAQLRAFPNLYYYLRNNDSMAGELSPQGDFVLLHRIQEGLFLIEVLHTETFKSYVIFREELHPNTQVSNLSWIDDDSFLYDLLYEGMSSTHVVHLDIDDEGHLTSAQQHEFPVQGEVVDTLLAEQNMLLFANYTDQESVRNDGRGLYKVDTSDAKTIRESFWKTMEHTRQFDYVIQWLTDRQGEVRSAIELAYDRRHDEYVYHHWFLQKKTQSSKWVKIKTTRSDEDIPAPVMLSADGQFFYAITNKYGEMKSIHQYDTTDYAYMGPYHEDPEHDIQGIKLDPTTQAITAYSYVENGTMKLKFFNEHDDRIKSLRNNNPGMSLYVRQYHAESGKMLVFGSTNFSKGAWYLYDEKHDRVTKLMDINSDYEQLPKGDSFVIKAQAEDGVMIEGYLVKPSALANHKPPLVVMPHGGPIGIRDYADNDEVQHFFAAQGLATLKVNYRGSSGFGKAFEALGNGQWGEKIEADIHQLVQQAVQQHQLNGQQICAMGGSYGGYSALMLTLLYPETYQCAVSFAGVMDLPLLFTGISAANEQAYLAAMKKIVGDPHQDHAKLVAKSPFYLAQNISKPIKLFHGAHDDVVSLEQSLRMQQAMTVLGKEVDLTILNNESHDFEYFNSMIFYLAESLQFIQTELGLNPSVQVATKTNSDGSNDHAKATVSHQPD